MVGLTYTPPLVPAIQATRGLGQQDQVPLVLSILSGAATGAVGDSLTDTLAVATGPGNILTGTVTSASPGGNFTLTTAADAEVTLQQPPELPIQIGSTVTLRIATTGPTPQATILSIDGRPVSASVLGQGTPTAVTVGNGAPSGAAPTILSMPGSGNASAYAASVAAMLDLEAEQTIDPEGAGPAGGPAADPAPESILGPAIATLIRPAPVEYGQQPLTAGMRYLVTLTEPSDAAAGPAVDLDDLPGFTAQSATLTAQIMPPQRFGALMLQTPLGTLSLDTDANLAVGTAVRLVIAAVAPPLAAPNAAIIAQAMGPSLIDQVLAVLTASSPSMALQAMSLLMLPTGGTMLSAAWKYIADLRLRAGTRDALVETRRLLVDSGHDDLAERLDLAAAGLGETEPRRLAYAWLMTTLPFLGLASEQPVRLYVREDDGNGRDQAKRRGDHMLIEVKLRRLGPMQFEGLARDRRLDLVVRTADPLEAGLVQSIETGFRDAIGACGCGGEIGFARITRFPFGIAQSGTAGVTVEA